MLSASTTQYGTPSNNGTRLLPLYTNYYVVKSINCYYLHSMVSYYPDNTLLVAVLIQANPLQSQFSARPQSWHKARLHCIMLLCLDLAGRGKCFGTKFVERRLCNQTYGINKTETDLWRAWIAASGTKDVEKSEERK